MKRLKYILLVIIFVLTTGFTNYDISMNIKKNKEMDFSINILSDSLDEIDSVISLLEDKNNGYDISRNDSDGKYGVKISKHIDNIDNISFGKRNEEFNLFYLHVDDFSKENETKMFNVDKQFDTNRYAANFYVDVNDLNIDLGNSVITYTLTLPGKTESNNAQFVNEEGNVLIWNIGSVKTDIDFVLELKSYDTIYYIVAILVAVFLVFSIISNLFSKGENDKDNNRNSYNKNNYSRDDIEKKIQNITQNAINKNSNNIYNINNNKTKNSNINEEKKVNNNVNNMPTSIPIVNPVGLEVKTNINSSEKKSQNLFDKLKKEDKSIGTLYDDNNTPTNEEFNTMISNVSNSNNKSVDNIINNNDNIDNKNFDVDDNSNNTEISFNNITAVPIIKQDGKLDINNTSQNNLNDMFEYNEVVKEEKTEPEEDNSNGESIIENGPVIKFNNKEMVITKNDEEKE